LNVSNAVTPPGHLFIASSFGVMLDEKASEQSVKMVVMALALQ